ncbi:probable protein phosphatase 2C 75 [Cynara cardunculus var. scolymus]|uniref:probable protein phosphatase 2C 75 n=1 Tax=Cynara cardunculus var. scolymus TaxID=59895 RepID=UPI000D62FE8A|nr:probable protein phosphatase 2C 75 [Cynara cardunculus var. scolymus]
MRRVYGSRRSLMPIDEDIDSPLKCRERRRRRIEMRRRLASVTAVAGADNWEAQKFAALEKENEDKNAVPSSSSAPITSLTSNKETPASPAYGFMSVVGRARVMEDEISVRTNLCRPEINDHGPVHFFAVFDGHGGHHVSALCKEKMHVIMEEELMRVKATGGEVEELWRSAINRSFERMDEMAKSLCQCDGLENSRVCRFHPQLSLVGSTAVVSLLTPEYIIVANCGDSRAVLCHNGKAVPLSVDHKPEREDERSRIEGLGGQIVFAANGARVEGVLAMSRAIGDRLLKHVVTWEPEYSFRKRNGGDTSLILASDGLWDVLSNEMSCEVVRKCQQEDHEAVSASASAAALLVRLAVGRRSSDNISVVVVDLRD